MVRSLSQQLRSNRPEQAFSRIWGRVSHTRSTLAKAPGYGYRRIHASLARSGHACSPELVRALVRELGLRPCQPRPWRHSLTDQDPAAGPIPDLLHRDFTASAPGEKMVGNIIY